MDDHSIDRLILDASAPSLGEVCPSLLSSPGGKMLFQRVNTIYGSGSKLVQIDLNLQGPGTLVFISLSLSRSLL